MSDSFQHTLVDVHGTLIHLVEGGNSEGQPLLFLHGFPENWKAFEKVMEKLAPTYRVIAIDLPGVGLSHPMKFKSKKDLAGIVHNLLNHLQLVDVVLVGHDVGGMIAYAFAKHYPNELAGVALLDTAIPGVEPWDELLDRADMRYSGLSAMHDHGEPVVTADRRQWFDAVFDALAADKNAVSEEMRRDYINAYQQPAALSTAYDWYHQYSQDTKDNSSTASIETPLLYVRGEKERGNIRAYVEGLRKNGVVNITDVLIADSGHFTPDENPAGVADAISAFIKNNVTKLIVKTDRGWSL